MNFASIGTKAGHYITKNSPAILMGLSLAGVLTTAYLTHKAAQKAQRKIDAHEAKDNGLWVKSTAKEKVQLTWQYYIPPVLSCGATIAFIIAGNTVHSRRQAALITAVSLGETAFSEYREKMVEQLGKGKERKARDEIIQDRVTEAEKDGKFDGLVLRPDTQDQYVFETYTGRTLVSSVEKLNAAANKVARSCINSDYATLNEFFSEIGLDPVPLGEEIGWSNSSPLEIDLGSAIVKDGKGLIAIRYVTEPQANFRDPWR